MRGIFERTIWTVIALALSLIALNPWLAPGGAGAGIADFVDITAVGGKSIGYGDPIPVVIVSGKK